MSARALLDGLLGVSGVVVGNDEGRLLDSVGAAAGAEGLASASAVFVRSLARLAEVLSLGTYDAVIIKSPTAARVIGHRGGAVAVVAVDPRAPTSELEARVRRDEWSMVAEPPAPPSRSLRPVRPAPPLPPADSQSAAPVAIVAETSQRSAVFTGDLQLFGLPDLLEFLRAGQRTGRLECGSELGTGVIYLRQGEIIAAESPTSPLVMRTQRNRGLPDALRDALLEGTTKAVCEIVTWTKGRFAFDPLPSIDSPVPGIEITVDSRRVLLDIFREQDERARTH